MKNLIRAVAVSSLVFTGVAFGAGLDSHPDLKAASDAVTTAQSSLKAANDHEKSEFGGHRAKAEKHLAEAQKEITAAAAAADKGAKAPAATATTPAK